MSTPILAIGLQHEHDLVIARQRARQIAHLLGFEAQDQVRLATAVSEIARNAFRYAGGGRVEFSFEQPNTKHESPALLIRVRDTGPGIADLQAIIEGRYRSATGMGLGIAGARRLTDIFDIQSNTPTGTVVLLGKYLPKRGPEPAKVPPDRKNGFVEKLVAELAKERPSDPFAEIQQQNQELLQALEELRKQKEAVLQANTELEETNRGVVALYAELDERADYLQRANDIKSRFLSNMTHEFRTPLNSIIGLSRILLQRLDGELTPEQEKQVQLIVKSAQDLSDLVNDLLDLAKVEAGKVVVHASEFGVSELFGALRGMLKPLLAHNSSVALQFEEPQDLPLLYSDESKVSQILRNFISNALKYTERGEVVVSAAAGPSDTIVFSVRDTGIGIAAEDQERIFEEFVQVDSPLQRHVKGTGLGLPLTRKLASLLGGSIRVTSQVGVGSTFQAVIPRQLDHPDVRAAPPVALDANRIPVLVIEDNSETLFVYGKYMETSRYQLLPARTLADARRCLQAIRPHAIVADVLLEAESTWGFLAELREHDDWKQIPFVVVTVVENEPRALATGAAAFHAKPIERTWLIETLDRITARNGQLKTPPKILPKILVVDDDPVSRYLLRRLLSEQNYDIVEAESGTEGLKRALEEIPCAIFLDLVMDDMDGFELFKQLKMDERVCHVPVIICTSKTLSPYERKRLEAAAAIVSKSNTSVGLGQTSLREALSAAGLQGDGARD